MRVGECFYIAYSTDKMLIFLLESSFSIFVFSTQPSGFPLANWQSDWLRSYYLRLSIESQSWKRARDFSCIIAGKCFKNRFNSFPLNSNSVKIIAFVLGFRVLSFGLDQKPITFQPLMSFCLDLIRSRKCALNWSRLSQGTKLAPFRTRKKSLLSTKSDFLDNSSSAMPWNRNKEDFIRVLICNK